MAIFVFSAFPVFWSHPHLVTAWRAPAVRLGASSPVGLAGVLEWWKGKVRGSIRPAVRVCALCGASFIEGGMDASKVFGTVALPALTWITGTGEFWASFLLGLIFLVLCSQRWLEAAFLCRLGW